MLPHLSLAAAHWFLATFRVPGPPQVWRVRQRAECQAPKPTTGKPTKGKPATEQRKDNFIPASGP